MALAVSDLTPEVRAYLSKDSASADGTLPSEKMLSAIGVSIAKLRDEAKEARISSGIEERWRLAEEAYAGIDDVNRGDVSGGHQWTKSMSKDGPISADGVPDEDSRSTLFVRLTQRYVDAGTDKLGEILLAPGAKSFSLSATPTPELINAKDDESLVRLDHLPGAPVAMRAPKPGELMGSTAIPAPVPQMPAIAASPPVFPGVPPVPAPAGAVSPAGAAGPAAPALVPATTADFAKEKAEKADDAAKKAEKRIYDWHVECRRTPQVRKVIFDAGRLGVGVLKGPFPKPSRQMATRKTKDGIELGIRKVVQPGSKWVNAWNAFPDPTCGEDIQDGDFFFEREWMGERGVRKLKQSPGYIKSQIDKVLLEGPQKVNVREDTGMVGTDEAARLKKGKYEVWYFQGTLKRSEMGCICEAAGGKETEKLNNKVPPEQDQVYAIVTMINDSVVRATFNPLDSGEFTYHAMPWKRRTGSWAGVGIAEQIDTPQRMLNGAVRAMMDNAGIAAGGQVVIDTAVITPADGSMAMSPRKIWYLNGDGERLNVNEAFGLFKIDSITADFMQLVELAMRLGEEATSIPLVTQGQSGPTTPDTLGATQLQNNNANQMLRSIAYTFDDHITVPETNQYYEYLILDPDVPEEEKGDWTIDAHGSNALVETAIQNQFIPTLGSIVVNPTFGLSPRKWAEMLIRANKMQPKDFQNTEEEQKKIDATPPAGAPAVEVAKIKAATDEKRIAAEAADEAQQRDLDRDALKLDHIALLQELQLRKDIATLEAAARQNTSVEVIKSQLAQTAMKITAQKELSAQRNGAGRNGGAMRPMLTPPTEPAGRADNGRSFEQ